jgi:hypothetical protein
MTGRAEADFGGGMSVYNLLFENKKIREGRGQFWRRKKYQSIIYYFKL